MLVKIQTFHADSHHPTAVARSEYLLGESRAIGGITTQNIVNEARAFKEIDETRERSGTRGSVTGRELVLSPSPDDKVTPEQMRAFAHEFLAEVLPDLEAAVVIHDDNKARLGTGEKGIPHAHVYLGTIDLESGRKLNLSKDKVRAMHDTAQDMSCVRGWSAQPGYQSAAERKKRLARDRQAHYIKGEYDAMKSGRPFVKDVIRDALNRVVRDMRDDPTLKLKDALEANGLEERAAAGGGYKYRMADSERRQFYGTKSLGREYFLDGVRERVGEAQHVHTVERSQNRRQERGGSCERKGYERGR